jgi:hypothetical protein
MLSTGLALSRACNASGQQALASDRDLLPRVLLNPLQLFRRFQKGKALEAVDVMLRGANSAQGQDCSGTNSAQGPSVWPWTTDGTSYPARMPELGGRTTPNVGRQVSMH